MPIPQEISLAQAQFDRFITEARDALGLATRNQAYTTVQAVLIVFRRRLSAEQVLLFADVLPAVLRAIFVQGWEGTAAVSFREVDAMEQEVRAWRKHHNFSPPGAIASVAALLHKHADKAELDAVLERLPPGARQFWGVERTPGER